MMKVKSFGFTVIEMVVTMSIIAILAIVLLRYVNIPFLAYNESKIQLEVANELSQTIHLMKRELKESLPNSIRITTVGSKKYIEFIKIKNLGKYRVNATGTGTGDILTFNTADTSFDVLSGPIIFSAGDKIVIENIGFTGFDVYQNNNVSNYNGTLGTPVSNIVIQSKLFPIQSSQEKFYVINNPTTYVCDTVTKTIKKYEGYAITSVQPNNESAAPLSSLTPGIIGENISACDISYVAGNGSRNGILNLNLESTKGSVKSKLFNQITVSNF